MPTSHVAGRNCHFPSIETEWQNFYCIAAHVFWHFNQLIILYILLILIPLQYANIKLLIRGTNFLAVRHRLI